jgi:hypothetical protein
VKTVVDAMPPQEQRALLDSLVKAVVTDIFSPDEPIAETPTIQACSAWLDYTLMDSGADVVLH